MEGQFDTREIAGAEFTAKFVESNPLSQRDVALESFVGRHSRYKLDTSKEGDTNIDHHNWTENESFPHSIDITCS